MEKKFTYAPEEVKEPKKQKNAKKKTTPEKVNNMLLASVLAVLVWIALDIGAMKEDIVEIRKNTWGIEDNTR